MLCATSVFAFPLTVAYPRHSDVVNKTIITVTSSCLAIILAWEILWHGWLNFTRATQNLYVQPWCLNTVFFFPFFFFHLFLATTHTLIKQVCSNSCNAPGKNNIFQSRKKEEIVHSLHLTWATKEKLGRHFSCDTPAKYEQHCNYIS